MKPSSAPSVGVADESAEANGRAEVYSIGTRWSCSR